MYVHTDLDLDMDSGKEVVKYEQRGAAGSMS